MSFICYYFILFLDFFQNFNRKENGIDWVSLGSQYSRAYLILYTFNSNKVWWQNHPDWYSAAALNAIFCVLSLEQTFLYKRKLNRRMSMWRHFHKLVWSKPMQPSLETNFIMTLLDIIIVGICRLIMFPFYLYANEIEIPNEKLYCQVVLRIPSTTIFQNRVLQTTTVPDSLMWGHMKNAGVLRDTDLCNINQTYFIIHY